MFKGLTFWIAGGCQELGARATGNRTGWSRDIAFRYGVFKGVENIGEAQVVQEAVDLTFMWSWQADLEMKISKKIKPTCHYTWRRIRTDVNTVSDIPNMASGKFKAVRCKLSLRRSSDT